MDKEIRLISNDGEQLGIVTAAQALKIAAEICVFTNDNIRCEVVGETPAPKKPRAKRAAKEE